MTTSSIDRRKFRRLELNDDAVAVDASGRELGRVTQASGGGMMIAANTQEIADTLQCGNELRLTVIEPGTQTQNTMDVIVRYKEKAMVGFEFVTGKK